jgi:hypothetical protein
MSHNQVSDTIKLLYRTINFVSYKRKVEARSYSRHKLEEDLETQLNDFINAVVPAPSWGSITGTVSDQAEYGAPNGLATLDGSGKVPSSQLTVEVMEYKGTWDANTNTPTLVDGTGNTGDTYKVSVAGTQDLGSGSIDFEVGDLAIYSGTIWEQISGGSSFAYVNNLWVDVTNGDDGTAEVGNIDKPYATLAAAVTASADGDAIHINKGTYPVSAPLPVGTKSLSFHKIGGEVIINQPTSNHIIDISGAQTIEFNDIKFIGNGTDWLFELNGASSVINCNNCHIENDGDFLFVTNNGEVTMKDCFLRPFNGGGIISQVNGTTNIIDCDADTSTLGSAIFFTQGTALIDGLTLITDSSTDMLSFLSKTLSGLTVTVKNSSFIATTARLLNFNANKVASFSNVYVEGGSDAGSTPGNLFLLRNGDSGPWTLTFEDCKMKNVRNQGAGQDHIIRKQNFTNGSARVYYRGVNTFECVNSAGLQYSLEANTITVNITGQVYSNTDLQAGVTNEVANGEWFVDSLVSV